MAKFPSALKTIDLVDTEGNKLVSRLLWDKIPAKNEVIEVIDKDINGILYSTTYYTAIKAEGAVVTVYKGKRV